MYTANTWTGYVYIKAVPDARQSFIKEGRWLKSREEVLRRRCGSMVAQCSGPWFMPPGMSQ
jgi:hypothetical protein